MINLSFEQKLKAVKFVVEANSCERSFLWKEYAQSGLINWLNHRIGQGLTIGHIDNRPIAVAFYFATLNNKLVMFYEGTSQLVDHKMIEDWLNTHCKPLDSDGRLARCDANNFHHCYHFVN